MDFTQTVEPLELGDGERFLLVYVDQDRGEIISISLEVVLKNEHG
ncbi:hypothetical protein [Aliiglaciecola sp. M165]|nr:hypothetical protein [Aliiglaciecola sp. M165]